MGNKIMARSNTTPTVCRETQLVNANHFQPYLICNEKRVGKLIDEVVVAFKDDRLNTKHAISADIAATARVQNQNGQVIRACEQELRRRDLPEERRIDLFEIMSRASESTANEIAASRAFQESHLDSSHKLPWKMLGWSMLILFGGIGGAALFKTSA